MYNRKKLRLTEDLKNSLCYLIDQPTVTENTNNSNSRNQ